MPAQDAQSFHSSRIAWTNSAIAPPAETRQNLRNEAGAYEKEANALDNEVTSEDVA
ncbi:MAG: hypothetical protein M3P29_10820 [Acidobacteriota bacterium]|nr:hypothetical protein [Acidobacteriota bacterium]